jgi:hydroxyacylglutathione hydrolase
VIFAEDEAGVREAAMRLARVGLERVTGYLAGGVASWDAAGLKAGTIPQWPVDELRARREEDPRLQVLDVRRPGEFAAGHVPGARSIALDRLESECGALDRSRPLAIVCASGYRSSTACSLLRRKGWTDVRNVAGGTTAWIAAGFDVERS